MRLDRLGQQERRQCHAVEARQSFLGGAVAGSADGLRARGHESTGVHDVLLPYPPEIHRVGRVPLVHFAHGHLAVAAEIVFAGALEAAGDTPYLHRLVHEEAALQPPRIATNELLRVPIEQLQQEVLSVRGQREQAAVGVDRLALRSLGEIVDHDVVHLVRVRVAAGDAKKELVRHRIHGLVPQGQRRFGLGDVALQDAQRVVGARQHLVVERDHRE